MFPFTIEPCDGLFVLRDDLIPGGTKRRALEPYIRMMPENRIAYAGTIFGYGALALALACKASFKKADLFLGANEPTHPMIEQLRKAGAVVHCAEAAPFAELAARAAEWANKNDARFLPPGFDEEGFRDAMIYALHKLDVTPYPEIWCSSVSGTLAKTLQGAFPHSALKRVSIVASGTGDHKAPEKYHQPARTTPPYASCPYTDAKIWQFAKAHARPGALIWNTAG